MVLRCTAADEVANIVMVITKRKPSKKENGNKDVAIVQCNQFHVGIDVPGVVLRTESMSGSGVEYEIAMSKSEAQKLAVRILNAITD